MQNIVRYAKLYLEFLKQNLKVMFEYKSDFVIGLLSTLLKQISGIFFVWIMFENIKQIHGWTFYQITFVYGMLTLAKSLDSLIFDNLLDLGWNYVREGKFDIFMLRPISPLFQLVASKIHQEGLGLMLIGLTITLKSISELHLNFGILQYLLILLFVISGSMILSAIRVITATSAFWTVSSHIVIDSVSSLQEFALYPILIYPKFIGILLTWIVPYAFASFYPASFFLGKGFAYYSFLSPVIAIVLWVVALRVWNFGLSHYGSTGS